MLLAGVAEEKITEEAESMGTSAIRMANTYQDVREREKISYCMKRANIVRNVSSPPVW